MDAESLEKFGYSEKWVQYGFLTDQLFRVQLADQEETGHSGWEHYRYAAFLDWLKDRTAASDIEIRRFVELARNDSDQIMSGSAVGELVKSTWLTDKQFESVCEEFASFGEWTRRHVSRYALLRRLRREQSSDTLHDCVNSEDSVVQRALLELDDLDQETLVGLTNHGVNKEIRHIARQRSMKI